MSLIVFQSVSKSYNSHPVLTDFSFEAEAGQRVVILGPSGCGKTTVLRLLAGFTAPDSGSIIINGQVVAEGQRVLKEPEERNLGMVFQDLALWPHLTVKGNLEFGLKARKVPEAAREERMHQILKLVQMEDYINAKPGELSGGQQQRIALARALVLRPGILLMDEPLSSLDYELNFRLRQEILRLQREIGFTLVYVTHNLEEASDIAGTVLLMKHGELDRIGSAEMIKDYYESLRTRLLVPKDNTSA